MHKLPKGPLRQLFFVVLLPDGTVVVPRVEKRLLVVVRITPSSEPKVAEVGDEGLLTGHFASGPKSFDFLAE